MSSFIQICAYYRKSHDKIRYFSSYIRQNEFGIQMIDERFKKILFGSKSQKHLSEEKLKQIKAHLEKHGLLKKSDKQCDNEALKSNTLSEPIYFQIPQLKGKNIEEHFYNLGEEYSRQYKNLADIFVSSQIPLMPNNWCFQEGWTKYEHTSNGLIHTKVPYPDENIFILDVEVCMNDHSGKYPTIAVCLSPNSWYSWVSQRLIDHHASIDPFLQKITIDNHNVDIDQLISLGISNDEKLVIGHNVSFDRSYVKEQYFHKLDKLRFLDTMSLHICNSGLTGYQRALSFSYKVAKKNGLKDNDLKIKFESLGHPDPSGWENLGSLNNLADVYKFHCNREIEKIERDYFLKGTLCDIHERFQQLMFYCANDVKATTEIFKKLWPIFLSRFPHPVTLAGMLEMSTMYLPVNISNWQRYLNEAQNVYDDLQREVSVLLEKLANEACLLIKDKKYEKDVWLWDLDWSVQNLRFRKGFKGIELDTTLKSLENKQKVLKTKSENKFCNKSQVLPNEMTEHSKISESEEENSKSDIYNSYSYLSKEHTAKIKNKCENVDKLDQSLTYDTKDLCATYKNGKSKINIQDALDYEALNKKNKEKDKKNFENSNKFQNLFFNTIDSEIDDLDLPPISPIINSVLQTKSPLNRVQPFLVGYPLWYRELCKHPFGASKLRPEEELRFWEPGTSALTTQMRYAPKLLRLMWKGYPLFYHEKYKWGYLVPDATCSSSKYCNFPINEFNKIVKSKWKNDSNWIEFGEDMDLLQAEQILSQNGTYINMNGCRFYKLPHKDGPESNVGNPLGKEYIKYMEEGCLTTQIDTPILQISKALSYWKMSSKRIYSQNVVAVSSEEGALLPRVIVAGTVTRRAVESLWLTASNAVEDRVGSELKAMIQAPRGYNFVGADVDSQELWIASLIGDSLEGIHGSTAVGWMNLQGNKNDGNDMHSLIAKMIGISRTNAKILNYGRIYGAGIKFASRFLFQSNDNLSLKEAKEKAKKIYKQTKGVRKQFEEGSEKKWYGGSESAMFNQLEKIAFSPDPRTPVLGCSLSTALLTEKMRHTFLTSVINWVVQSSGVDYLHLLLVGMKWAMSEYNIDGRFAISIHDEVRYLIKESDSTKAALGLQLSNLMVRAIFSSKLGIYDLPESVAWFSGIDIDKVLRKEVDIDCITPSNKQGLKKSYGIPFGQCLTIQEILEKFEDSIDQNKSEKYLMEILNLAKDFNKHDLRCLYFD